MIELKPCPFCGGRARINTGEFCTGTEKVIKTYGAYCIKCSARIGMHYSESDACNEWNRRANDA